LTGRVAEPRFHTMATHRDSQGFYRTLGVPIDASTEEIQRAYERMEEMPPGLRSCTMGQLSRAYSVLMDEACRRSYDQIEMAPRSTGRTRKRKGGFLADPRVLVAGIVLLVGILTFVWYPLYGGRLRSFSPGDRLVDLHGAAFGVVVEMDETHAFPGGISVPAYLVEMSSSKELRWFPAEDIKSSCRKQ